MLTQAGVVDDAHFGRARSWWTCTTSCGLTVDHPGSATSWPKRLAARYEAPVLRDLERRLPGQVEAVVAISRRCADLPRDLAGNSRAVTGLVMASHGVNDTASRPAAPEQDRRLHRPCGRRPDVDAVEWLSRGVRPRVQALDPTWCCRSVRCSPAASARALRWHDVLGP